MKFIRHAVYVVAALLLLFASANAFADCGYSSGEEACFDKFGDACSSTGKWCLDKDCLGRNFGDEVMFIGAGKYPKIWIAETDGVIVESPVLPCSFTTNNGISIIQMGDMPHCATILVTEDHLYWELFASIPETECVAWLECKCS